ncbi:hypothetical protein ACJMK2_003492 [Sinanodonta woodiana]|uniref:Claudin n=1 Tax=Sinanodonta woodiana TaxID=1069815 RepID=A0ABD3XYD9_SINWO
MTSTLVNCIFVFHELRNYIAISWGVVALVLNGHSINMPEWVFYQTNDDFRYSIGLWKNCTSKSDGAFDCVYISDAPGFIEATRTLNIIAIILNVTFLSCLTWVVAVKGNESLCNSALYAGAAAGIVQLVGDVTFAVKYTDLRINNGHLSSCFVMTVASSIMLLLAAGFLCLIKSKIIQNKYVTLKNQDGIS